MDCGWIDKHPTYRLVVHDWEDHSDQTLRRSLQRKKLDFVQSVASNVQPSPSSPTVCADPPEPEPEQNLSSTDVDAGSPPKSWYDQKHEVWYRNGVFADAWSARRWVGSLRRAGFGSSHGVRFCHGVQVNAYHGLTPTMGTPARGESHSQRAERAGKRPDMGNYHPCPFGRF